MKRGVAHLVKAYPVLPHLRTAESNYRKLTPRVPPTGSTRSAIVCVRPCEITYLSVAGVAWR